MSATGGQRVARGLLALLLATASAPGLAALAISLRANGPTFAGLALASAVVGWLAAAASLLPRLRRRALLVAGVAAALGLAFVAARLVRPSGPTPVALCFDVACGSAPWLARIPPEHEAARAGLFLSGALGTMRGAEFDAFDALLDAEYGRLADTPWARLPNALLLRSRPGAVWWHQWVPPGSAPRPTLVFLHGFGGQLTPYLRAMVDSELGRDFVIVAPALDTVGAWWTPSGTAVVEHVLDHLPPEADPRRVFLVGLSNGAVGATRLATLPRLRARVRGAVLVSGIGEAGDAAEGARLLVLAGARDPRFRWSGVEARAEALREAGAVVSLERFDADHFLLLTHAAGWTRRAREWLADAGAR